MGYTKVGEDVGVETNKPHHPLMTNGALTITPFAGTMVDWLAKRRWGKVVYIYV